MILRERSGNSVQRNQDGATSKMATIKGRAKAERVRRAMPRRRTVGRERKRSKSPDKP